MSYPARAEGLVNIYIFLRFTKYSLLSETYHVTSWGSISECLWRCGPPPFSLSFKSKCSILTCSVACAIISFNHYHHVVPSAWISLTLSSLPFSIVHCFWQVLWATSCIGTELWYVGSSWSFYLCRSTSLMSSSLVLQHVWFI